MTVDHPTRLQLAFNLSTRSWHGLGREGRVTFSSNGMYFVRNNSDGFSVFDGGTTAMLFRSNSTFDAISPDGLVVLAHASGESQFIDSQTGKLISKVTAVPDFKSATSELDDFDDGVADFPSPFGSSAVAFDLDDESEIFSPNGLYAVLRGRPLLLVNTQTGEVICKLKGERVRFSPDSSIVITERLRTQSILFALPSGKQVCMLDGAGAHFTVAGGPLVTLSGGRVRSAARSPFSVEPKFDLRVSDASSGAEIWTYPRLLDDHHFEVATSATGNRLIITSWGENLSCDIETGGDVKSLNANRAIVSSGGQCVLKWINETSACLADAETTECLYEFSLTGPIVDAAFDKGGTRVLICDSDGTVSIWNRRRPEHWWGIAWMPEFWLGIVLTAIGGCSIVASRRK
ncbi:MAG TPA: WD40 repeat domain-containing protein [Planctomycetota bacterium]|nr:WD40 repeat domain-containing protein [Planctomycetota bacterium]